VSAPRRIALVSEVMTPPWDEGIRIFGLQLLRQLSARGPVLPIAERPSTVDGMEIVGALTNRWFLSRALRAALAGFAPEAILYIPWTSLTARTMTRARLLKRYGRAPVAVLALQPRGGDVALRLATRLFPPGRILSCGPGVDAQARALGIEPARIPAGVDLERFRPIPEPLRGRLRERAGVKEGEYVVLHVGHLKTTRNIEALIDVAGIAGVRAMLVASSSMPGEEATAARLREAGVMVMTHHQDRIEVVYQLADAYLFPVASALDAIETPLSVLEAAACDLPIIATRFGALPDLLAGPKEAEVCWAESRGEIGACVRDLAARRPKGGTRALVAGLGWDAVAARVLEAMGGPPMKGAA
jgi:glycosyltransferase involved in cell wall biosynthesis